jgi:hypothetical protein
MRSLRLPLCPSVCLSGSPYDNQLHVKQSRGQRIGIKCIGPPFGSLSVRAALIPPLPTRRQVAALLMQRNQLAGYAAAGGVMPPMLHDERACTSCFQRTNCATLHKARGGRGGMCVGGRGGLRDMPAAPSGWCRRCVSVQVWCADAEGGLPYSSRAGWGTQAMSSRRPKASKPCALSSRTQRCAPDARRLCIESAAAASAAPAVLLRIASC